jgi:hypothetical protein
LTPRQHLGGTGRLHLGLETIGYIKVLKITSEKRRRRKGYA